MESMATTVVPSVMVNLEALTKDNYKYWSFRVKTYLLAEDLWDLVEDANEHPKLEDGEEEFKAWRKNNARALQAITILCGKDAESSITYIQTARDAWNTLAQKFMLISESSDENSEVDSNEDDTSSIIGDAVSEIDAAEALEKNFSFENISAFFDKVKAQDWEAVKEFIEKHPEAARAKFDYPSKTALHYAVWYEDVEGVKALLPFMKNKDLEILDYSGHTALSLAIILKPDAYVMIEIIKCIIEKNKKLLLRVVHPSANTIPLVYAMSLDKPKMAEYLYSVTPLGKLKSRDGAEIISAGLRTKRLDIPLDFIEDFERFVIAKDHSGESPLNALASNRARLFLNPKELGIWERLIYKCILILPRHRYTREVLIDVEKEEKDEGNQKYIIRQERYINLLRHLGINGIYQMKLLHHRTLDILLLMCKRLDSRDFKENYEYMEHKFVQKALFQAVERGNVTFIRLVGRHSPALLNITDEHDKSLFQFAAEQRQEDVLNLIYGFGKEKRKDMAGRTDNFGNNMLHAVGKLSPLTQITHIRGAALQMQYELHWFKKVERMASPNDHNCINSDGLTPREVFTINHRDLVKEGELSMKETATSSSALVAALIITIMFAAAVTVPGGINGDTGIPIYLHTKAFRTFIVADVISLCSSTTSVMVFLGILTSRFAEEDFLTSLPTKLIIGFLTVFLSIGAMMIAFASAIIIMLPEKPSIVISSVVLASIPIASFLWMQFPFLLEIIISTYGFRVFKREVQSFEYSIRRQFRRQNSW